MTATANGLDLLNARITMPRSGPWHADVSIAADAVDAIEGAGAVTLAFGDAFTLTGTTMRAGVWMNRVHARIVGGAHGMPLEITPKSYRSIPARVVVADILRAAGETIATTSNGGALARILPAWTRAGGTCGNALAQVVDELEQVWRVLPDGTVWIGTETWPNASIGDYEVVSSSPESAIMLIGVETPALLPGTTFEGGHVGRVVHVVLPDSVRTEVYFDGDA